MADQEKVVFYDNIDADSITGVLMELAKNYPGLNDDVDETFHFCSSPDGEGLSLHAISGAAIYDSRESVTGKVTQMCEYPFMVVYKASGLNESRKIELKEWIDAFGSWLSMQPVTIKGVSYKLGEWPDLPGGRKIKQLEHVTPAYLAGISEDKCENWVKNMVLRYRNEFYR